MNKYILAGFLLITAAGISRAQVTFGGGAQAGLSISSFPQPLNEFFGLGFGGGGHADINVGHFFTTRMNVYYSTFSSDKTKMKGLYTVIDNNGNRTDNFTVEGFNASVLGITLNGIGKIPTHSAVTPYGILGFGIHMLNLSDIRVIENGQTSRQDKAPAGETDFGLNFGLGSEFLVGSRTRLFFDVQYALVFTQGSSTGYIPFTLGVSF